MTADAAPEARRPRRGLEVVFLLLGIVGLAGVAVGVAAILGATVLSPTAFADRYVASIAAGDSSSARDALAAGAPLPDSPLLADEALASAHDRIEVVDVRLVASTADAATVAVAYRLAGERFDAELELWRGPGFFGLASDWRVATPLVAELELSATGPDRVVVNDAVEVDLSDGVVSIAAYPGVYAVSLPADERFFEVAEPIGAPAPAGESTALPLTTRGTAALAEAVTGRVGELLEACAASTSLTPPGCPFFARHADEYRDLAWQITSSPRLELSADGTAFSTAEAGQAIARFESEDFSGRGWKPAEEVAAIEVSGAVAESGGVVEVVLDG